MRPGNATAPGPRAVAHESIVRRSRQRQEYVEGKTLKNIHLKKHIPLCRHMVRMAGLEPARLSPLPPQDSVSTSSTTSARGPGWIPVSAAESSNPTPPRQAPGTLQPARARHCPRAAAQAILSVDELRFRKRAISLPAAAAPSRRRRPLQPAPPAPAPRSRAIHRRLVPPRCPVRHDVPPALPASGW